MSPPGEGERQKLWSIRCSCSWPRYLSPILWRLSLWWAGVTTRSHSFSSPGTHSINHQSTRRGGGLTGWPVQDSDRTLRLVARHANHYTTKAHVSVSKSSRFVDASWIVTPFEAWRGKEQLLIGHPNKICIYGRKWVQKWTHVAIEWL